MSSFRYTLASDRTVEYAWVKDKLPTGTGFVLDVGCGQRAHMSKHAVQKGYTVVGIDLCPVVYKHNKFTLIEGDLLKHNFKGQTFDAILNISSIEHFGLKGRYGITRNRGDADTRGMKKLHSLLKPNGIMILTIPLGLDAVHSPHHRVYGRERLPELLGGYRIKHQFYWSKKDGQDKYVKCTQTYALNTESTVSPFFYAIGGFVLERDELLE